MKKKYVYSSIIIITILLLIYNSKMIEKNFIYFPDKNVDISPGNYNLIYDDVYFKTEDSLTLHGWFIYGKDTNKTVLWFHGNAGNISHRVHNIKEMLNIMNVNIFIFDYRGYGNSEGKPSEKGTYIDAKAALNYLQSRSDIDQNQIIYFGRSLGSAIASNLATQSNPKYLILESPIPSIPYMAKHAYPFLPISKLLKTQYDTIENLQTITKPVLIIHGDKDNTVPIEGAMKVFESANDPKQLYIIKGADHNDTYLIGGYKYFEVIDNFIR